MDAHVLTTLILTIGLCFISILFTVGFLILTREQKDRPVIPWGRRMALERAKATTEISQEHLNQKALEIKRLALDHRQTQMMKLINDDAHPDEVQQLALPAPKMPTKEKPYRWEEK